MLADMWKPLHPLYNFYRRYFGRYELEDPRPIAHSAPYTYYLPSSERQNSVASGDLVQLLFNGKPMSLKYGTERMWVKVTSVTSSGCTGDLSNDPYDMPQLKHGDKISFQPFHIIDFKTERDLPEETPTPQFWDRCMVDRCVLDEAVPVYYLYREEPDLMEDDDEYGDTGWRIRGDYRSISDEEFEARKATYIAVGKVLNADDSWLHLIDEPTGSAFMRNFETGEYEPYERGSHDDD